MSDTPRTDSYYSAKAPKSEVNWAAFARDLERENAALREALVNADEIERYSGSDGHRQWGKCSTWLMPDDAVIVISAKVLDAARKEAQP